MKLTRLRLIGFKSFVEPTDFLIEPGLTGVVGLKEETHEVTLKPGTMSRVDFRLPADVDLRGQVAELRLDAADDGSIKARWTVEICGFLVGAILHFFLPLSTRPRFAQREADGLVEA